MSWLSLLRNIPVVFFTALLCLYWELHAIYVFTSKNASADDVAPLSLKLCLQVGKLWVCRSGTMEYGAFLIAGCDDTCVT